MWGGGGTETRRPELPHAFQLVADVFSCMLVKVVNNNIISGIVPHIIPHGLICLQYADDTILFLNPKPEYVKNLKWLLACFENLSGLKINYDKCEVVPINMNEEDAKLLSQIFCCKLGDFPLKYLGVSLHYLKLRREDIQYIIDKIIKRICGWKGRLLSYEAKLVLLKACIASIPMYLMSVIKFPKWAIKAITS